MKRTSELISGIATQIFMAMITVWIFTFSKISNHCTEMTINYLYLTSASVLAYIIEYFLARKGAKVPVFVLVTAIMTAAGVYLFLNSVFLSPESIKTRIIICIIYALSFISAAFITFEPVKYQGIMSRFDLIIFMTIIILLLSKWLDFPALQESIFMCILALLASIIALISIKSGSFSSESETVNASPSRGKLFIIVIAVLLAVFAACIYIFASAGLQSTANILVSAAAWTVNAVKYAAGFLWKIINTFFLWLASFFSPEKNELSSVGQENVSLNVQAGEAFEMQVPVWFYILLAAFVLTLIIIVVFRLRKYRFKTNPHTILQSDTDIIRKSRLKNGIKNLFSGIKKEILFRVNCIRYKNTVPGIYMLCRKTAPEELLHMSPFSPITFLREYAQFIKKSQTEDSKGYYPGDAMLLFAEIAEKKFYSAESAELPPELIKNIRKEIKGCHK